MSVRKQIAFPDGVYFPSPQSLRRDSAPFIGMQLNPILQFFSAFYFCMLFITIVKFALYYGTFLIFPFLPGNLINKSMFICNSP